MNFLNKLNSGIIAIVLSLSTACSHAKIFRFEQNASSKQYLENEQRSDKIRTGNAIENVIENAVISDETEKLETAVHFYEKAISKYTKLELFQLVGESLEGRGDAYILLKQFDKAFSDYENAITAYERAGDYFSGALAAEKSGNLGRQMINYNRASLQAEIERKPEKAKAFEMLEDKLRIILQRVGNKDGHSVYY